MEEEVCVICKKAFQEISSVKVHEKGFRNLKENFMIYPEGQLIFLWNYATVLICYYLCDFVVRDIKVAV